MALTERQQRLYLDLQDVLRDSRQEAVSDLYEWLDIDALDAVWPLVLEYIHENS